MKSPEPAERTLIVSPNKQLQMSSPKYTVEKTDKKERSIYDESSMQEQKSVVTSAKKTTPFPTEQHRHHMDPNERLSMAIKLIEEIEHSSRKEEEDFRTKLRTDERGSSSDDSNDSLIQTQRKLK